MEDVMDFPCWWELEVIGEWRNYLGNFKGSFSMGSQLLHWVMETKILPF